MQWYELKPDEVIQQTHSKENGLSTSEAHRRFRKYGPNELEEKKKRTQFSMLLGQFKDVMILILLAAAIVSGLVGDITDAIVILVIVILNALIGFLQDYRAEKAMEALKKMTIVQATPIRDGKPVEIPATELVPGDVVQLESGYLVPADLRIIESNNLRIDESALTGESQAVDKISDPIDESRLPLSDQVNMAFKGTSVAAGKGMGIVIATGMKTELGRIARMLQEGESQTPLQKRMSVFARKLSILVLVLCLLFFIAGWLRGEDLVKMVLTSISLAVAAIPEALPAVITISLALAARWMIRLHCLIRKLPAVETLGSVTYICTDKTGTLTENKMHVEEIFLDDHTFKGDDVANLKKTKEGMLLFQAFALNNDAVQKNGIMTGDPTEIALLELADKLEIHRDEWPRIAEIPFESERKLMTTFHEQEGHIVSFTKGAPDVLLKRLDNGKISGLSEKVDEMAARGLRVLGFAFREWKQKPDPPEAKKHETGLKFLGLAGLIDPPRTEVPEAVKQCRTAGIIPVMITGDHPLTAENIAGRIGILTSKKQMVVTGRELSEMASGNFAANVEKIRVYARVSPEQKLQIVKALQDKGHFVAMTGDGVNDAPSLKRANIGIAMGITGTDVSKEAADMVLLDDNFSTIVKAVREGRRIYDNILKFIKFLMTTNSSEILTLLLGPLIGLPVALLPIHILWINLVSDGLPAISLSFEKAEKDIMDRPPRPPQQTVFADGRGLHMIWVGMLMAGIALSLQAWAIRNDMPWQTMVFNFLCLGQMAHVLAIRSDKQSIFQIGLFSNKLLIISVITTLLLQALITYVPIFQLIFKTETLNLFEFALVGTAALIVFIAVEVEKFIKRKQLAH